MNAIQRIAQLCAVFLYVALTGLTVSARAATPLPVELVTTDLESLIKVAAKSKVQFAVHVPHPVSSKTMGQWQVAGGHARWQYALRIPTAVSMSFHATHIDLPPSATLSVRGLSTTTVYHARDLHNGTLWSRIQPGDFLEFTLDVDAAERARAVIKILSFQAGYRGIGAGVADHPAYRRLMIQAAGVSNTSCVQNYECSVSTSNRPQGQATVGLIIGNLYQCSGTLINDVPGDTTPYVLTARHCEAGTYGGGDPGAAAAVTVYWDATTPCGAALGSLYDPGIATQTGSTTVVEQEDAWLIRLASNPVVTDAEFAGFDATGGAVQGGYTIHHALGYDKQYTTWHGQAFALLQANVLGSTYISHFWETVNQTGNHGPGASGSALFDQADHLVGSLSLGRTTSDPSGYGSCPAASPPAPNGSNGSADFTSLSAIWNSTADATSTTGTTTLKSVLDPANTGTKIVAAAPGSNISFSSIFSEQTQGLAAPLLWNAPGASGCTAGGGVSGDGWSGSLPASGTQSVSNPNTGDVTYTLVCTYAGGRSAHGSLTISWLPPAATATLTSSRDFAWTTLPVVLKWTSNTSSCGLAGGSLLRTNLPGSGSVTTTQTTAGDVDYILTCGSAPNVAIAGTYVAYQTPSVVFEANAASRLVGEPLELGWVSYADSCIPAGGAPNDGWTTSTLPGYSNSPFVETTTTLGTYTFSLTCISGPLSVQKSVTATLENLAPFVTTSVDKPTVTFTASPADYFRFNYTTNLTTCTLNSSAYTLMITSPSPVVRFADNPEGSFTFAPPGPGTWVLSETCTAAIPANASATSAPITVTVLPPPAPTASISVSPSTVTTNQAFTITWSSTNAASCDAFGGSYLDSPFVGYLNTSVGIVTVGDPNGTAAGSLGDTSQYARTFTLGVTCQSIDPNQGAVSASTTLIVGPPVAKISVNPGKVAIGSLLTVTWSSAGATGCTASGGGADGIVWQQRALADSGSVTQKATTSGTFTYTVTCSNGVVQSSAVGATVTVAAPATSGGGSGGGGGGGALGVGEIGMLGVFLALQRRRRHAGPR